jgi:hypothetical protein
MSHNCIEEDYVSACCREVLKKFHCLLNEADELYEKSDKIIDTEVLESICIAIKSLEKAFELGGRGEEIENKAYKMLDKSGCGNACNKNSAECKELYDKAEEKFALESEYLTHALNSLKCAQKDVKNSMEARKAGYRLRDQYTECVHGFNKCQETVRCCNYDKDNLRY